MQQGIKSQPQRQQRQQRQPRQQRQQRQPRQQQRRNQRRGSRIPKPAWSHKYMSISYVGSIDKLASNGGFIKKREFHSKNKNYKILWFDNSYLINKIEINKLKRNQMVTFKIGENKNGNFNKNKLLLAYDILIVDSNNLNRFQQINSFRGRVIITTKCKY